MFQINASKFAIAYLWKSYVAFFVFQAKLFSPLNLEEWAFGKTSVRGEGG